ncbi:MAG TPA: ABC transporter permease [Gemmatimonadaceae bacterium]|nr:ABC transporter permease [Gemmatimonadaceae bacterium]
MLITETILAAFASLRANKTRALLTMLGIVIGIGAVITIVAMGNGAKNAVADRLARLGTTVLQIDAQRAQQGGIGTGGTVRMTSKDADTVAERSPHVVAVNYTQDRQQQIEWRHHNASVQITGTVPNFLAVRDFKLQAGRMFTDEENHSFRRVAVLGGDVPALMGPDSLLSLVGEDIKIKGRTFTVIGQLVRKGTVGFGDGDEQILIPFQTSRTQIYGDNKVDDMWARVTSEDDIPIAMGEIAVAMRRAHKLRAGRPDDFRIRNQADILVTLGETTQSFTLLLAGVAAVSLLVGGVGIMNIMLVSVTERTREIGVRKALGATRRMILLQFMIEALTLCILGGAVGVTMGVLAAWSVTKYVGWHASVDVQVVALALGVAGATGLLFGVWPARRAAALDPIEALRHE